MVVKSSIGVCFSQAIKSGDTQNDIIVIKLQELNMYFIISI